MSNIFYFLLGTAVGLILGWFLFLIGLNRLREESE